jgi:23S rRNA (guanosine2251-2'-O)-methyltransferase
LRTRRRAHAGVSVPARSRPPERADLVVGRQPVLELLKAGHPVQRVLIARGASITGTLGEIRRRASASAVPTRVVPKPEIDKMARELNHQGVVAVTARFRYTPIGDLLKGDAPALIFLDGVTDPHNVGSLLRSADGAGINGLVLLARRGAGVTPSVRKVAAGAAEFVPVARVGNLGQAVEQAKIAGLWIVGLDQTAEQDVWSSELLDPPVGLVLGAEGKGLSSKLRDRCDGLIRIPQQGRVGSLNVAVAGAIAMFEIARRKGRSATL